MHNESERTKPKILLKIVNWLENIAIAIKNRREAVQVKFMRPEQPRGFFFSHIANSFDSRSYKEISIADFILACFCIYIRAVELQQRLNYFAIVWLLRPNFKCKIRIWCCVKGKTHKMAISSDTLCAIDLHHIRNRLRLLSECGIKRAHLRSNEIARIAHYRFHFLTKFEKFIFGFIFI